MSKQKRVYLVFIVVFSIVAIVIIFLRNRSEIEEIPSQKLETIKISQTQEQVLFEDEAGFSFEYYNDFIVADITPDNDEHYSLLSIVDKDKHELVKIELIDTKYKNLGDWLGTWEKESSFTAKLVGATALGNISANNYRTEDKFITIAIDKSVLYLIETANKEEETKKLYEFITKSFKIALPEPTTANDTIYETEEVIE